MPKQIFSWRGSFSIMITKLRKARAALYVSRVFVCLFYMRYVLSLYSFSWCLGLAAACDCVTPWTFNLTFVAQGYNGLGTTCYVSSILSSTVLFTWERANWSLFVCPYFVVSRFSAILFVCYLGHLIYLFVVLDHIAFLVWYGLGITYLCKFYSM